MPKAVHERSVSSRPLDTVSPSVLTVTDDIKMPLTLLERRMTVVRLNDGRLVVYSAIALDDAQMQVLAGVGRPAFLVVPNRFHRQDASSWKQRYPEMIVVAPAGARAQIEEVVPVDTCHPDFGDERVRFLDVPGTAGREGALEVREADGITLILNDIVGNLPKTNGLVLRALGFATERPRIPRLARRFLVPEPPALRRQLEAWADLPVARILVSHGRPIAHGARESLAEMASSL